MTAVTAVGLLAAVLVVAVGLLSLRGTGDGRDLLDWDTGERRASRADARDEELALGLAEHNRRRAARGLPAQTLGELEEAARDAGG